jgi:hypothetical protein
MRRALAFVLLAACSSDYDLAGDVEAFGEFNPQPIEIPTNTDRIVQTTAAQVDVLFVIDNSGSMSDNQRKLGENFPEFMKEFDGSGLDYHIGVISTDTDDPSHNGKLRPVVETGGKWIDDTFADPVAAFANLAMVGATGSGTERGREACYRALVDHADGANAGFIREDAGLHITVVSDEDDSSTANPISKTEFIDYLNSLREEPEMVSFNSIVHLDGGGFLGGLSAGTSYIDITDEVGGLKRDIANDEWENMLTELGLQAIGLKAEYFLSQLPVEGTIEVNVIDNGVTFVYDEGTEWTYSHERNSITFVDLVPKELSQVVITYTLLSAQDDAAL